MKNKDIELEQSIGGLPQGFSVFLARKLFLIENICQRNLKNKLAQEILAITTASPDKLDQFFNE